MLFSSFLSEQLTVQYSWSGSCPPPGIRYTLQETDMPPPPTHTEWNSAPRKYANLSSNKGKGEPFL